ncbi:hypothetical protein ACH4C6_34305 [Streptomyces sp. NPDC017943]|uniref:hypothetical protein n=1 Tax=Streptomyces sp. NPDC017943 TaxID=3365019 RepID=UPI0037A49D0F
MTFDPARFTCAKLAGELADEWVELVEDARYGPTSATHYRQTIEAFCTHVDATSPGRTWPVWRAPTRTCITR